MLHAYPFFKAKTQPTCEPQLADGHCYLGLQGTKVCKFLNRGIKIRRPLNFGRAKWGACRIQYGYKISFSNDRLGHIRQGPAIAITASPPHPRQLDTT